MHTTALACGGPAAAHTGSARRCSRPAPPPQRLPARPSPPRRASSAHATPPEGGTIAIVGADGPASSTPPLDIAASPPTTPPTAAEWQLDFSSRPVLDDRGKKVWELLVCDGSGDWVHAQYLPSNRINSTQVGDAERRRARAKK